MAVAEKRLTYPEERANRIWRKSKITNSVSHEIANQIRAALVELVGTVGESCETKGYGYYLMVKYLNEILPEDQRIK